MSYKLPKKAREYVLYQRTHLLPKRDQTSLKKIINRLNFWFQNKKYKDFVIKTAKAESSNIDKNYFSDLKKNVEKLLPHIPKETLSILDIGCGIAGLDIILNEYLKPNKIYLLDKTKIEKKIWYGFKKSGAFYNSLELAKKTFELNGVNTNIIELIDAPIDGNIPLEKESIDLVISTISWGFHYPIKTYIKSVLSLLKKKGVLIIDLRLSKNTKTELDELSKFFHVEIIDMENTFKTIRCVKK